MRNDVDIEAIVRFARAFALVDLGALWLLDFFNATLPLSSDGRRYLRPWWSANPPFPVAGVPGSGQLLTETGVFHVQLFEPSGQGSDAARTMASNLGTLFDNEVLRYDAGTEAMAAVPAEERGGVDQYMFEISSCRKELDVGRLELPELFSIDQHAAWVWSIDWTVMREE